MSSLPTYILVTPARNEARFIELTLQSVVAQTVRPLKWLIVSDGSTDGTDDIVRRYAAEHPWIELLRMPDRPERHFGGKALGFNTGYARIKHLQHDIIGNVDADISFEPDCCEFLLRKFAEHPELGVAGAPFREGDRVYDYRFVSIEHVSGACQLFRRQCFEDIGGYQPSRQGGVDHIAVITARMRGWKTRTFTDRVCLHHRGMGSAGHSLLQVKFRTGALDYALGGHPVWELLRASYQTTRKPYIIGGLTILAGYLWASAKQAPRPVSRELIRFRRCEQMRRLREFMAATRGGREVAPRNSAHS